MRPSFSVLALSIVLASAPAFAQQAGKMSSQDREFIPEAVTDNMLQVDLGTMAEQHGANPEVRKFGQRMVEDHGKFNKEITGIAERDGMAPPKQISADQQREVDRLSSLQGEAFDNAYMPMMVQEHQKYVKTYQKEIDEGQNSAVKRYAQDTLPTLKEHLSMAQSIAPQGAAMPESGGRE
ncbi:MAG: DUF4142 domain-containing protein [Magnetospirillum sp.]|nr:DUF4142 domain-containing protein [Magnetospirillum sp.]